MGSVRWKVNPDNTVDEIHTVVVYKTTVEVNDGEGYGTAMWHWRNSPQGRFIFEHCVNKPEIVKDHNPITYQIQFAVIAELETKKLSEFYLKWGNTCGNN